MWWLLSPPPHHVLYCRDHDGDIDHVESSYKAYMHHRHLLLISIHHLDPHPHQHHHHHDDDSRLQHPKKTKHMAVTELGPGRCRDAEVAGRGPPTEVAARPGLPGYLRPRSLNTV